MKTSIEVEYWVVDGEGKLTAAGDLVDLSEQVEGEFVKPLLEMKTTPCETVEELRNKFVERLHSTVQATRARDRHLVPLGTPLSDESIEFRSDERTAIQRRVLGESFDHAKHCAGTHVHFEQEDVLGQLNALTALDPAFALLNTSPYYRGERVAACARPYVYRRGCYRDHPEHGQLREYAESVEGRERELGTRFEAFKRLAAADGVSESRIEELFEPDDTVWTPVRLRRSFPTVEWRSPDAALPSEVLRLVSEMAPIVRRTGETPVTIDDGEVGVDADGVTLPAFETLERYVEEAMTHGLESTAVTDYLERMGLTPSRYRPIGSEIDGRSTVSPRSARRLRLRYARRLERDVRQLSAATGRRTGASKRMTI
ncbi:glutamate-cysteine ligase family protein [Halalkalicoccus salilacus]|uniref:glutamate-cysteine ligase family protein n=1 Tax=Halalkalicoccus TaxID=332246 RepID=UPI002F96B689